MEVFSGSLQGGGLPRNPATALSTKAAKNSQFNATFNLQHILHGQTGSNPSYTNQKSGSAFHQLKLPKGAIYEASSIASTPNTAT